MHTYTHTTCIANEAGNHTTCIANEAGNGYHKSGPCIEKQITVINIFMAIKFGDDNENMDFP
jgi:hypothetical protein